jgi:hypothetical protein
MHGKMGSKSNRDLIDSASALEAPVSLFDPSLRAGLLRQQMPRRVGGATLAEFAYLGLFVGHRRAPNGIAKRARQSRSRSQLAAQLPRQLELDARAGDAAITLSET